MHAAARHISDGLPFLTALRQSTTFQEPEARLAAIRAAGEAQVPFTSGLLIGIGETRKERVEALLKLQDIHLEFGHIEVKIRSGSPSI